MALGDIYEVKHVVRDFDQKHLENVYFYRHDADPAGGPYSTQAERLANDWNTDVLTPMLPQIPGGITTTQIIVRNLFDPADQYTLALNRGGTYSMAATEHMPSFTSGIVTMSTSNGLVRKGRKMLFGLAENMQKDGLFTPAGLVSIAIRAALTLVSVSNLLGGAKAFNPVVVKRIRSGTPGNYTYRLPASQIEAVFGYVQSAVASAILTTQVTRKK